MRIWIDPEQDEFVKVTGPQIRFNGFEQPNPIRPNEHIEFDYQRAHLIFDAPGVASYTGFLAQYGRESVEFPQSGVVLSNVTHNNPPEAIYSVTPDERYLAFTLTSTDGQPLTTCKRAMLSLVASSTNTELVVTEDKEKRNGGGLPVLVTRVGATITADCLQGMRYVMKDFQLNTLAEGRVEDGTLVISDSMPVFEVDLTRE